MHPFAAKFLTENFGVLLFGKHENLKVLPLPGHRVTVTRQGKFALMAKISELVIVLPHAFLLLKPPREESFPLPRGGCAGTCSTEAALDRSIDDFVRARIRSALLAHESVALSAQTIHFRKVSVHFLHACFLAVRTRSVLAD
jgi:hypothetical protein